MIVPVSRLKKKQLVWLSFNYCKHGHTYLNHYECYLKEKPPNEKIGFFDIETFSSGFKANAGIVICYCIKEAGKDKILYRSITPKELKGDTDKEVVRQCIKDLMKFDRIISYYGKNFDMPFIRTRALYHGLDFPIYQQIFHNDIYYTIRSKFSLTRKSLEVACKTLLGKSDKTHFDFSYWFKAVQGDKKALKYILDHCRGDVKDLEKLYNKVNNFTGASDTSI